MNAPEKNSKNNCCRIATPDGGALEIRTGGNIQFDNDGPGMVFAQANYPLADFVETNYVKNITRRALSYIKAGFPVHFREGVFPKAKGRTMMGT